MTSPPHRAATHRGRARSTFGPIPSPSGWDTICLMTRRLAVLVPIVLGIAGLAWGQFRGGGSSVDAHLARDDSFDGKFHYCRAVYRLNPRGDGGSWLTDYPLADIDLSVRLSELTKVRVSFDATGQPNHLIVRLTGEELYRCP